MISDAEIQGTKARLEVVETFYREAARDIVERDERIRQLEMENRGLKGEVNRLRADYTDTL